MEALWQHLQEQQIKLQKEQQDYHSYDLTNMESINHEEPPLPPPRKYVSIFRINGEPILPPLMTIEKRKQMQKFKEKALQIEKHLRDRKQHINYAFDESNEEIKSETSRSSHCNTSGSISQRSQYSYENKLKQSEESMILLKNIIKRQEGGAGEYPAGTINTACNTMISYNSDENIEKMQKLQKSEILIYDNSTNEVIQVPAEKNKTLMHEECSGSLPPKKPSQLLLAGVDGKGLTSIPSICLNPPTPLTVNKHISDSFGKTDNNESLIISENTENFSDLAEELSSNESLNSMRTHSDKISTSRLPQNCDDIIEQTKNYNCADEKLITPSKNVSAKIQQFESISGDSATPPSSPEKLYKPRKPCLGALSSGTMNRSATSPSIKLSASNRSSSSKSQSLAQDSDSPENSLVRSSSFTLEGPSKALIDHMRQQKTISESKPIIKSPPYVTRTTIRRQISSPLRAHRDTVESKAKKVQKVELKSTKQKFHQKASQSKLAQAAVASISPHKTTALNQHANNLYKSKKSPYDLSKTSHTTIQTIQKTPNTQMRKSNSASSNLSQRKSSKPNVSSSSLRTTTTTPTTAALNNLSKLNLLPNEMDKLQKEKFQRLLAQQEEEQRRLQQSFEMQQKLLLEQLNREMVVAQLKSPINSSCNSSPHYVNLTGLTSTPKSEKQTTTSIDSKQYKPHHQQQPSSLNLSSSKNLSQTVNTPYHLSYSIHYTQSLQTIPTPVNNSSHVSSMDYSNANTSLDISTLSTQTSPDTMCSTPNTKQNSTNNCSGNKTLLSTSSSRRRLFTTETNAIEGSRSAASSSYSMGQRTTEQMQQLHQNKTNIPPATTTNDSNRRLQY